LLLVVRDDEYKGEQVGYKLLDFLVAYAKECGVVAIVARTKYRPYYDHWVNYGFVGREFARGDYSSDLVRGTNLYLSLGNVAI
jgi:GNAT superfamily N-acetyltransferase